MNKRKTRVLQQAAKPQIPTVLVAVVVVIIYVIFTANIA